MDLKISQIRFGNQFKFQTSNILIFFTSIGVGNYVGGLGLNLLFIGLTLLYLNLLQGTLAQL